MDRATRNELSAASRGMLDLPDGRRLVVRSPGDADFAFLLGELRKLAKRKVRNPMKSLKDEWEGMPEDMRVMALKEAMALQSGGEVEPTQEQIQAQMYDPIACRLWVWWLARDDQPELTVEGLAEAITETSVVQVLANLRKATKLEAAFPLPSGPRSSAAG